MTPTAINATISRQWNTFSSIVLPKFRLEGLGWEHAIELIKNFNTDNYKYHILIVLSLVYPSYSRWSFQKQLISIQHFQISQEWYAKQKITKNFSIFYSHIRIGNGWKQQLEFVTFAITSVFSALGVTLGILFCHSLQLYCWTVATRAKSFDLLLQVKIFILLIRWKKKSNWYVRPRTLPGNV